MSTERIKEEIEYFKDRIKFLESLLLPIAGSAGAILFSEEFRWLPYDISLILVSFLNIALLLILVTRESFISDLENHIKQIPY